MQADASGGTESTACCCPPAAGSGEGEALNVHHHSGVRSTGKTADQSAHVSRERHTQTCKLATLRATSVCKLTLTRECTCRILLPARPVPHGWVASAAAGLWRPAGPGHSQLLCCLPRRRRRCHHQTTAAWLSTAAAAQHLRPARANCMTWLRMVRNINMLIRPPRSYAQTATMKHWTLRSLPAGMCRMCTVGCPAAARS